MGHQRIWHERSGSGIHLQRDGGRGLRFRQQDVMTPQEVAKQVAGATLVGARIAFLASMFGIGSDN
jgi:hypothetical protein